MPAVSPVASGPVQKAGGRPRRPCPRQIGDIAIFHESHGIFGHQKKKHNYILKAQVYVASLGCTGTFLCLSQWPECSGPGSLGHPSVVGPGTRPTYPGLLHPGQTTSPFDTRSAPNNSFQLQSSGCNKIQSLWDHSLQAASTVLGEKYPPRSRYNYNVRGWGRILFPQHGSRRWPA